MNLKTGMSDTGLTRVLAGGSSWYWIIADTCFSQGD
jgi:hypothetical protein